MGPGLPEELWGPEPTSDEFVRARSADAALARSRFADVAAVSLNLEQAAALARRRVDQVQSALDAGELRAVAGGDGPLIPSWQLRNDAQGGFLPGVPALAEIFAQDLVALTLWMLRPSPDLERRTPAQVLADGHVEWVLDTARTLTAAGW